MLGAGMYSDRSQYPLPDLFVTDLRLGEDSGVEFLAWLRRSDHLREVPVIVLSGAATPADIHAIKEMGVSRILQKPSDTIALQDLLVHLSRELCPDTRNHLTAKAHGEFADQFS